MKSPRDSENILRTRPILSVTQLYVEVGVPMTPLQGLRRHIKIISTQLARIFTKFRAIRTCLLKELKTSGTFPWARSNRMTDINYITDI